MDIMTLAGLIASVLVIVAAIAFSYGIAAFINLPGIAIVVVGTLAVTLIKYRLLSVTGAVRMAFHTVFLEKNDSPINLVFQLRELALLVRKQGILGLEDYPAEHDFLRKAITLAVDGHQPDLVEDALMQEMQQATVRYETAEQVFRGVGETAPALGMMGTLVGLVQMLRQMDDPSAIGPAMAVALLTTFYGVFIANVIALPLADKLQAKKQDEQRIMAMIVTSMRSILEGQNPRVMQELLTAFLEPTQRGQLEES